MPVKMIFGLVGSTVYRICISIFVVYLNGSWMLGKRVPYTFSVTRDLEFYFSVIRDSWYKSNFDFFVNVKSYFEFPVMREKAK